MSRFSDGVARATRDVMSTLFLNENGSFHAAVPPPAAAQKNAATDRTDASRQRIATATARRKKAPRVISAGFGGPHTRTQLKPKKKVSPGIKNLFGLARRRGEFSAGSLECT